MKSSFNSSFSHLYIDYRRGAKKRSYEFDLNKEQFYNLTQQPCTYCQCPPSAITRKSKRHKPFTYNGVDRVDNTIGYVPQNVVPCCGVCNRAKQTMTVEEFRSWIMRVYRSMNHEALET